MTSSEDEHSRRSIRLSGYDYASPGAYFVTICTQDRKYLFGRIVNAEMTLNEFGHIADNAWRELPCRFPGIEPDEFMVMPNHIHGIIRQYITNNPTRWATDDNFRG